MVLYQVYGNLQMIRRVSVIGLGLIGGSLCLSWKKRLPELIIEGHDSREVLDRAEKRGAIDKACYQIEEIDPASDLIVIATPIATSLSIVEKLAGILTPGTIVTDVGSVKKPISEFAQGCLKPENPFIGGHPMAGSEKNGIHHADPFLFENATYVLTPGQDPTPAEQQARDLLVPLIEHTGANVMLLEPERHDRIAAAVSHLPQLLAVTLMNLVHDAHLQDPAVLQLAAGGFRDMTRIASSPFDMWKDILVANEGPILDILSGMNTALQKMRNRVFAEDTKALSEAFNQAGRARNFIPKNTKGFLHPLSDVYVYAEDKPGFLFKMMKVLHNGHLDIKDIELLKIREGIEGAFRIGFEDLAQAQKAVDVLTEAGYTAFLL